MEAEAQPQRFQLYEHLYQIYPDIPQYSEEHKTIQKYETINKRFSYIYGKQPKYFIKCPGSIVIFGDSGDYSKLSYVECCTLNDTVIAIAQNNSKQIRVNHFQKTRYPQQRILLSQAQFKENDQFRNLIILALRVVQALKSKTQVGLDILVFSDLLDKNDLSKTTSFVICLILGMLANNGDIKNIDKWRIKQELQNYTKTFPQLNVRQSLFYAQNNKIVDIPSKQSINFFNKHTLVMAHSCTPFSTKSIQLKQGNKHNLRRCQIKLGIELIKIELGIEKQIKSLKQLKDNLNYNTSELFDCAQEYIPNKTFSAEQLQQETEKSLIELLKQIPYSNIVIEHYNTFFPYKAFMSLIKQELLIDETKTVMFNELDQQTKVTTIKRIIGDSRKLQQEFLEEDSEEVKTLVEIANQIVQGRCFKLVGDIAKGNIIFLVEKHRAQFLIDHLSKEYYGSKQMQMQLSDSIDQYVYEVVPTMGAAILDPQYEIWL